MELAHSSVMLQPKYQTIQCHIPANSNRHALFCITEGHVSGQKNQLILQILNAHKVYFMHHLILNFSSLTVQHEAWIARQYSDQATGRMTYNFHTISSRDKEIFVHSKVSILALGTTHSPVRECTGLFHQGVN